MELYRYIEVHHENSTEVKLKKYQVVKETPCGYWIIDFTRFGRKWVSKTGLRAFACTEKKHAALNFYHRKKRQVAILSYQLRRAKISKITIEEILEDLSLDKLSTVKV